MERWLITASAWAIVDMYREIGAGGVGEVMVEALEAIGGARFGNVGTVGLGLEIVGEGMLFAAGRASVGRGGGVGLVLAMGGMGLGCGIEGGVVAGMALAMGGMGLG